ncbi:LysR family transcriptional regulator [Ferrimonas futtsuensis]|uniref:LysR family transcriptional regulator n=1 Tax=Ferrimonas futtsuensis TaxID=364764 RepID=UPI00041F6DDB|nr:LysR family transcriptional regulator [Ferrimonas futtsuensis]
MNKQIKYDAYQMIIFDAVASVGSFTRAAERLEVSISHVSKQVKDLEQRLGVKLIKVNSRNLTLTREGMMYAESCRQVVNMMKQASDQVMDCRDQVSGQVRVAMSHSLGSRYIQSIAERLQRDYPGLALEVTLGDCRVDMLEDDVDLWFTTSNEITPGYIAQRLCDIRFLLLASETYLASRDAPQHPRDLQQHNCIIYQSKTRDYHRWSFSRQGEHQEVEVSGNFVIDSAEAILDAVVAGMGIGYIADYLVPNQPGADKLVNLLEPWQTDLRMPVYAVYPSRAALPNRLKAVIEVVRAHLNASPD